MMPRRTLAIALSLATCLAAGTVHASGDDAKDEAERRFRAGVALQKVEDWDAAIVEFQTSLRLYRTKGALFNLANALRATHRYVEALEALQELERDFGDELDPGMRATTDSLTNELQNLTGSLLVEVNEPGAEIQVDGELIGKSPLPEPIRLSVGNHRVDVTLEGYTSMSVQVNLASREEKTEKVALRRAQPEPAPAPPPATAPGPPRPVTPLVDPVAEAPGTGVRTGAWVATGAGLALVAAGTATGVWALTLDRGLENDCIREHCPVDRADDIDRLNRLGPTTNVLLTVGAVATATGVTLLVVDRPRHDVARRLRLVGGPRFLGATLGGTF